MTPFTRGRGVPHRGIARWSLIVLVLLAFAAGGIFFPNAGRFLMAQDSFLFAETAIVLSGDPVVRTLAARDLYHRGRVGRILVIPEPPHPTEKELVRLGLLDPNQPAWSERILTASRVPKSNMAFLPQPVDGTIREALQVRRFFKENPPGSVVVVASKFNSRRARWIFRAVLEKEKIRVYGHASPYDPFDPARWWGRPREALKVFMEYLKFIPNFVQLALGPHEIG